MHVWLQLLLVKCSRETNLQLITKLLRVRNKATICISFVEPRAAADLCGLLLPVHCGPYAVIELHVVSPSICAYNHIFWVWLNWKKNKIVKRGSQFHCVHKLAHTARDHTRVIRLLQLKRVNDTERKPDALWLHLLTVEPVRLDRLIDIVVVWHHGTSRNNRSSSAGWRWRCVHMCRRRLKKEEKKHIL